MHTAFGGRLRREPTGWVWSDGTPAPEVKDMRMGWYYNFRIISYGSAEFVEVPIGQIYEEEDLAWLRDLLAHAQPLPPRGTALDPDTYYRARNTDPGVRVGVLLVPIADWDNADELMLIGAKWDKQDEAAIFAKARELGWQMPTIGRGVGAHQGQVYRDIQQALEPRARRFPTDQWVTEPLPLDDPDYRWDAPWSSDFGGLDKQGQALLTYFLIDTVRKAIPAWLAEHHGPADLILGELTQKMQLIRRQIVEGLSRPPYDYHAAPGPSGLLWLRATGELLPDGVARGLTRFVATTDIPNADVALDAAADVLIGLTFGFPYDETVEDDADSRKRLYRWLWYHFMRRYGNVVHFRVHVDLPPTTGARNRYRDIQRALKPRRHRMPTDSWFSEPLPLDDPSYYWPVPDPARPEAWPPASPWEARFSTVITLMPERDQLLLAVFLVDTLDDALREDLGQTPVGRILPRLSDYFRFWMDHGYAPSLPALRPSRMETRPHSPAAALTFHLRSFLYAARTKDLIGGVAVSRMLAHAGFVLGALSTGLTLNDSREHGDDFYLLSLRATRWLWMRFMQRYGSVVRFVEPIELKPRRVRQVGWF